MAVGFAAMNIIVNAVTPVPTATEFFYRPSRRRALKASRRHFRWDPCANPMRWLAWSLFCQGKQQVGKWADVHGEWRPVCLISLGPIELWVRHRYGER